MVKIKVKSLLTIPDNPTRAEIDKIVENLEALFSSEGIIIESEIFDTEILN